MTSAAPPGNEDSLRWEAPLAVAGALAAGLVAGRMGKVGLVAGIAVAGWKWLRKTHSAAPDAIEPSVGGAPVEPSIGSDDEPAFTEPAIELEEAAHSCAAPESPIASESPFTSEASPIESDQTQAFTEPAIELKEVARSCAAPESTSASDSPLTSEASPPESDQTPAITEPALELKEAARSCAAPESPSATLGPPGVAMVSAPEPPMIWEPDREAVSFGAMSADTVWFGLQEPALMPLQSPPERYSTEVANLDPVLAEIPETFFCAAPAQAPKPEPTLENIPAMPLLAEAATSDPIAEAPNPSVEVPSLWGSVKPFTHGLPAALEPTPPVAGDWPAATSPPPQRGGLPPPRRAGDAPRMMSAAQPGESSEEGAPPVAGEVEAIEEGEEEERVGEGGGPQPALHRGLLPLRSESGRWFVRRWHTLAAVLLMLILVVAVLLGMRPEGGWMKDLRHRWQVSRGKAQFERMKASGVWDEPSPMK